jgi:hypothetical protein
MRDNNKLEFKESGDELFSGCRSGKGRTADFHEEGKKKRKLSLFKKREMSDHVTSCALECWVIIYTKVRVIELL